VNSVGIPVVQSISVDQEWKVAFYAEFEHVLFSNKVVHSEIQKLISFARKQGGAHGFRREITIDAFPFLCAVRMQEKTIYVGTRRLSRELALLKLHEYKPESLEPEIEKDFLLLKEHIEKISSLSAAHFPAEIEWISFENDLPFYWNREQWMDVEEEAQVILKQLVKKTSEYRATLFEKISDYGLTLTAQFELIRIHLLKFLALLPSLDHDKSGKEVKKNLLESLRRLLEDSASLAENKKKGARALPFHLSFLFSVTMNLASVLPARGLATVVRFLVRKLAKRFIAGESIGTAEHTLRKLRRSKREVTLDQLGELVVSSREADEYFEKVLQLIHGLRQHFSKGEKNSTGKLKAHISIKVSGLCHDMKPQAFEATYAKVAPRLRRILQEAAREEVFINIDAEHYHYRDLVFKIYSKVLLDTPELSEFAQTGIVIQAYLRDATGHLLEVVDLARKRGLRMPIRLVKGAYWDAETIEATAHEFIPPQFLNKVESDFHLRQIAYLALQNHEHIHLALGSHNLQDHAFVEALRTKRFPQAPIIEHQCLHMTYEALSHAMANMGWPTRNYMPIGNLLVGMAYLVRRIMENSSQVGILSIMRSHQKANGLIPPTDIFLESKQSGKIEHDTFLTQLRSDFTPVRPLRLHLNNEREGLENEIHHFEQKLILGQDIWSHSTDKRVICSSRPETILGTFRPSNVSESVSMVESAEKELAKGWWSKCPLRRVSILLKAADMMHLRRNELTTLMIFEAGKTMSESLAEVDEAIDFINYYCRQEISIQISAQKVINRGVIVAIAPWNFPLAIPCGMAVAPLVAGNAVIFKPSEQTPLIGQLFYELLLEAGVPKEIFYIVQGEGEIVGAPLVTHHRTAGIVFTGSKGVGMWIYKSAADKLMEHYFYKLPIQKKVLTEMGGKNAIIVTNNCELDETISGILYAAFAHAGQKCSAASRIIVHAEVKDALVARLVQAIKDLKVGQSLDPETSVSPLISAHDQDRVRKAVEEAKDEAIRVHGKIHIDRSFEKVPGFCVGPALLELPLHQAKNRDSWAQREIFGPVIHLIEYHSLIEAVEVFNGTQYALTGGIYSQSQDDIDFLLKFLRAGNLYVNRPNTGARVAIEPFGGFKLSGTGPKAGGPDYVWQFHHPLIDLQLRPRENHWAQDSGYQLLVPRPSLISVNGRLKRFESFANNLLSQYERLMGEVCEHEKAKLKNFVEWIQEHLPHYLTGNHLNHVIPGQSSYLDKSMVKEAGMFVAVSELPSLKSIFYLLSTMALGCGISVVCVTERSYQTWKELLDMAWKAGFSKTNLDVTLASDTILNKFFHNPVYSFVYAGRYVEQHDQLYKEILGDNSKAENMRQILSEVDGVTLDNPSLVLDQFIWIRAVAVNTMRHGAPLELFT
jgi:RHH-type transcriptional regulator, proline utilization regulon repressor / proline dehydrogenase / delta 1-pyrroline-5-carboxylate dehydrogenase